MLQEWTGKVNTGGGGYVAIGGASGLILDFERDYAVTIISSCNCK